MGPSASSALAAAASTSSALATSAGRISERPPSASTSLAALSRPSRPLAMSPIAAPRLANARTVARPTPEEAPVTTTTSPGDMPFTLSRTSLGGLPPESGDANGRGASVGDDAGTGVAGKGPLDVLRAGYQSLAASAFQVPHAGLDLRRHASRGEVRTLLKPFPGLGQGDPVDPFLVRLPPVDGDLLHRGGDDE